jgi:biopolymer transport protein ExbB/TolQ
MLGTMVGFVMMLNSMGDLTDFNVETLREGLQKMIAGMAVSLLTTIVGLIGGILLRLQYNLSEAVATDILQTALRITETGIVPRMTDGARAHV